MVNQSCRALFVSTLLILPASQSPAIAASWRVERGEVRILVPLKPGGAFTATTPSLSGTLVLEPAMPARLTGEITMDLATIETGIGLRNQHLREKYLEIGKGTGFDKAVLSEIELKDAEGESFEGRTSFRAMLLLHGVKHAVSGTADIRRDGPGRRVQAEFPLDLTDFGMKAPEYLGVGVASKLLVRAQFSAMPADQPRK
jgi:polyisoprenoid-binding protein YceI